MNPRKRAILQQRGGEIAKAGRLFFEAVFGDSKKFVEERGGELERELAERGAIDAEGEVVEGELVEPRPRAPSPPRNRGR
jgi:hypothetical protein